MHNDNTMPEPDFSEHYLEMAFRTDLRKRPETACARGVKSRECGDALEIFLDITDGVITKVQYYSNGCFSTNACGNAVAELAVGQDLYRARELTPQNVADFLETLPAHEFHCAEMAVGALHAALDDYIGS